MRFMVNENVSGTVIHELRSRGHDVLSVKESMRSEKDHVILARAQDENRLVVTHDKGFGELAFRYGLPISSGVILFRLSGKGRQKDVQRVLGVLLSNIDLTGHFSVGTNDRIRMRPLPIK